MGWERLYLHLHRCLDLERCIAEIETKFYHIQLSLVIRLNVEL
jgi:hypothetical protein